MFRTVSLQRRIESGPQYHRKTAATPAATFRSPAALFLQNFESAIDAASVPPRNDVGLSPCAGRDAVRVSANSERRGRQLCVQSAGSLGSKPRSLDPSTCSIRNEISGETTREVSCS
jgi:hypothetical protein